MLSKTWQEDLFGRSDAKAVSSYRHAVFSIPCMREYLNDPFMVKVHGCSVLNTGFIYHYLYSMIEDTIRFRRLKRNGR